MKKKVYGIYFAYSKELYDDYSADYPVEMARIHKYASKGEQLDAFANTMCSASQCITADSEKEFLEKVEQMKANFGNPEWVREHIDPYC